MQINQLSPPSTIDNSAAHAHEARLRLALEAARMGTWERNLLTGEDFWSPAQEAMFEILPGEFASRHQAFMELVHPEDRVGLDQGARRAIEEGIPYRSEYRIVRRDGSVRWMAGRGDVIRDAGGRATHMVGITVDITERKQAEEERARRLIAEQKSREAAEAANRLKDEFLATVSHELRTPLNAILGWTQLLRINRDDPEEVDHGLATIERNAKAMGQLVEDVLDVSRIIRGKLRLKLQPVELAPILETALAAVRPAAQAKGVRLERSFDLRASAIAGDHDRLQQIVWNLLSNAIKFTPEGGSVTIRLFRSKRQAHVSVQDTGVGIDPEFLPHVFERFSQADTSTRRAHMGLGLGLAIVRHLVELHGGSVRASSPGTGRGATFEVSLPLRRSASAATDSEESPLDDGQETIDEKMLLGVRVLIVDDDPDARELAQKIMQRQGADADVVCLADEAMESIRNRQPDVLISDIGLPHRDGYDLIRSIRSMPAEKGGRIPAIAMTGFASTDDRARVMAAGFEGYIAKPIVPEDLVRIVRSVLPR